MRVLLSVNLLFGIACVSSFLVLTKVVPNMLSRYPPKYTSRSLGLLWGNNYVGCSFGGYPTGNTGGGLLERPTGYKYNDN